MTTHIDLRNWGIVKINDTPHLLGSTGFGSVRISTALVWLDPGTDEQDGHAETLSGRLYTLLGEPARKGQLVSQIITLTGGSVPSYDIEIIDVEEALEMLYRVEGVKP